MRIWGVLWVFLAKTPLERIEKGVYFTGNFPYNTMVSVSHLCKTGKWVKMRFFSKLLRHLTIVIFLEPSWVSAMGMKIPKKNTSHP